MLFFFFFDILADQTTLSIDDSACSAVAGIRYYLLVSSMALSISHGVSLYRKAYGITTKDLFHRISILISTGEFGDICMYQYRKYSLLKLIKLDILHIMNSISNNITRYSKYLEKRKSLDSFFQELHFF